VDLESPLGQEFVRRTDSIHSPGSGFGFFGSAVEAVHVDEGGGVVRVTIPGPKGDLVWRHKRTEKTSACVEFPCRTAADIDKLLAVPFEPSPVAMDGYRADCERFGEELLVMPGVPNAVCLAADTFSPEDFCMLWATDPVAMAELVAVGNERLTEFCRRASEAGMECLRIVGGEYVTVQLGPSAVEPLLGRFDTALCDAIHAGGGLAYYHCHGPIMRYLADLRDLGIDALDPLEAPPWGDCDLAEAKEILRGRTCIVGNLDDMEVLEKYPEEEIRRIGRERLAQAGPDGFVLGGTASGTFTEKGARGFMALAEVAGAELPRS
jgi:uroporphyrinogen-III decarboxylase